MTSIPSLHFVTQLWGEAYVRLFGETVLPGFLSEGNFGSLSSGGDCVYEIFSTDQDFENLSRMSAFNALTDRIKVDFVSIDEFATPDRYQTMSACHRQAIARAEENNRAVVFLQPDVFLADGTIRRVQEVLGEGKRAVLVPGFYVLREAFLTETQSYNRKGGDVLQIPPRDLAKITLRHLHPISQSMIWGSSNFNDFCPHLYWKVGEDALYARCAHVHPLAVYPRVRGQSFHPTIDWNYFSRSCPAPGDWYVVNDSDDICIVDLCPSPAEDEDERANKPASVETVVDWAEYSTTGAHRRLLNHSYRFHAGDLDDTQWAVAEEEANSIINRVLADLRHSSFSLLWRHPQRLRIRILGWLHRVRGWLEGRRGKGPVAEFSFNAFEIIQGMLFGSYRYLKTFGRDRQDPPINGS